MGTIAISETVGAALRRDERPGTWDRGVKPLLQPERCGFTLIELLVVIGLIALAAGVLGVALRGGNPGVALQSAQGTLGSMLSAARTQAALSGRNAALMIHNDPSDADRYLRAVAVAVDDGTGVWVQHADYVMLASGCAVVPEVAPSGGLVDGNGDFSAVKSTALLALPMIPLAGGGSNGASVACLGVQFSPTGTLVGGGGNLVLASVSLQPPSVSPPLKFTNADNVRGLVISHYGAVTFINDKSGF